MDDSSTVTVSLAGISLVLEAPASVHLRDDSLWRLRRHYQPFLASCSLPASGRAMDIGAGFGAFALPFAKRYPSWQVWCFEPNQEAFAALTANIARLGLENVRALPLAIGGAETADEAQGADARHAALLDGDGETLRALCRERPFRQHATLDGYLQAATPQDEQTAEDPAFRHLYLPCLPATDLKALKPDLVKLIAPHAEAAILTAFKGVEPAWLVGETWQSLSPSVLDGMPAKGAALVSFARAPGLALREKRLAAPSTAQRAPGLGIIAALNCSEEATALRPGLPERAEIHLILPPEASLPVEMEDGIHWHRADHAGAAPAFNLGLRHCDAAHLVFLGSGERPRAAKSLHRLQDLARLTGAEIVQGGDAEGPGWVDLPRKALFTLDRQQGAFLQAATLLSAYPPSTARLYRRDFLDQRGLHFSEHLGDFARHAFHFRALTTLNTIPVLPSAIVKSAPVTGRYGEEAFLLLEAFRRVLRDTLLRPALYLDALFAGMALAVGTVARGLDPALGPRFLAGLAEFLVLAEKALGRDLTVRPEALLPQINGLGPLLAAKRDALAELPDGYAWGWLDAPEMQASMARQARLWNATD